MLCPPIARHERHPVDHHEALDPLGMLRRPDQRETAPVVHDEPEALEPEMVDELAERSREAAHGVVAVRRLAAAAEPREVERDTAGALEEREPVIGVHRDAVHVDDRRIAR